MLAFILGFATCWLCGGLWTAHLCNVHDKGMGNTTRPSILEIVTTVLCWPYLWHLVANEDIDDFWGDDISDEWKHL